MDYGKHQDNSSETQTCEEAQAKYGGPNLGRWKDPRKSQALPQAEKLAQEQLESLGCTEL